MPLLPSMFVSLHECLSQEQVETRHFLVQNFHCKDGLPSRESTTQAILGSGAKTFIGLIKERELEFVNVNLVST